MGGVVGAQHRQDKTALWDCPIGTYISAIYIAVSVRYATTVCPRHHRRLLLGLFISSSIFRSPIRVLIHIHSPSWQLAVGVLLATSWIPTKWITQHDTTRAATKTRQNSHKKSVLGSAECRMTFKCLISIRHRSGMSMKFCQNINNILNLKYFKFPDYSWSNKIVMHEIP